LKHCDHPERLRIGRTVREPSIFNWESNKGTPEIRFMPAIIRFLGYNPMPEAKSLAEQLIRQRTTLGMSREGAALEIGVDPGALARWERREREPTGDFLHRAERFLDGNEARRMDSALLLSAMDGLRSPPESRPAFLQSPEVIASAEIMLKTTLILLAACALLPAVPPSIETSSYTVRFLAGHYPSFELLQEGQLMFRVPLVAGLSSPDAEETLTDIQAGEPEQSAGATRLRVTAVSSLWKDRRFEWAFYPDHIEFQQFATGERALERCYFFSNGISANWENGTSPGVFANTTVYARRYFSPNPNHGDQYYFTTSMPQSVGVLGETPGNAAFHPEQMNGLFAPAPLFFAFERDGAWAGVGLGAKPGEYLFNSLEYSGSRYAGASFWVNYRGYKSASQGFASPLISIHFAHSEFDSLEKYVSWTDANHFGTQKRFPNARWHHLPVFCGWAEQTREAAVQKIPANRLADQKDYERWIAVLERRGLPFGTIVIDDKWQKGYGTFDVDERKWPDMKGFIDAQHAKGRHVVLWVPAFHAEGLPQALCVKLKDGCIAGDVTNPKYEEFLRSRIRHLVADLGADGFKEDWLGGVANTGGLQMHAPLFGIEFVRRFQFILHDEAHKWKPDAFVETQTPNPLFRESSDVLRLNDIWYGARDVPQMMRRRARISKIAGWDLVDCDNASSTTLEEWWSYMQEQPSIGIPALYFVYRTESSMEEVPDSKWRQLAEIWKEYLRSQGLPLTPKP
jgi:transcriptional regulator with XRE-family HTH domain